MAVVARPFHEFQAEQNAAYYARRGKGENPEERLGFETPSHDPVYVEANAREFIERAHKIKGNGEIHVHEFGAADGTFAEAFLNYLRKHASDVYDRTRYHAWDKSEAWRENWKDILRVNKNASFGVADVQTMGKSFDRGSADVVYCHELFDDLPTKIVAKRNGRLRELWIDTETKNYGVTVSGSSFKDLDPKTPYYEEIARFMKKMPDNVNVPINLGAAAALVKIRRFLKKGGVLRAFDYGYLNEGLNTWLTNQEGVILGGGGMVENGYAFLGRYSESRADGGRPKTVTGKFGEFQVTSMVNFAFINYLAKRKLHMKTRREPHAKWASRIMGSDYVLNADLGMGLAYDMPEMGHDEHVDEEKMLRSIAGMLNAPQAVEGFLQSAFRMEGERRLREKMNITKGLMRLVSFHDVMTEGSELRKKIDEIIAREGDDEKGLEKTREFLRTQGFNFFGDYKVRSGGTKRGYVIAVLRAELISEIEHKAKFEGTYSAIRRKARKIKFDNKLRPIEPEIEHAKQFADEIEALKKLGFKEDALKRALFGLPQHGKATGGLARVSFTAVK